MAQKITPKDEMVPYMLYRSSCNTFGIGLGPLFSYAVATTFQIKEIHTQAHIQELILAFLWSGFFMVAYVTIPQDLGPFIQAKDAADAANSTLQTPGTPFGTIVNRAAEHSDDSDTINKEMTVNKDVHQTETVLEARRHIWFFGLLYGIERAFMVAALEAATAMLLEVQYGFALSDVGLAVGCTFLFGAPAVFVVEGIRRSGLYKDVAVLFGLAGCCLFSTIFLPEVTAHFVFGENDRRGYLLLLLADALIFPSGFLANGIAEGLANKHAIPGSFYSQENLTVLDPVVQNSIGRFLGPALARLILAKMGRDAYFVMQFILSTCTGLGAFKIMRSLRLVEGEGKTITGSYKRKGALNDG